MDKIKAIISSLAELTTPDAISKLNKYASDLGKRILQENNDEKIRSLELLESFAFKVPGKSLSIVEMLSDDSAIKDPTEYDQPYKFKGQSYVAVLDKALEIIRQYNLRYGCFEECFKVLLRYYLFQTKNEAYSKIRKKAQDIIVETADYNMKIIHPEGFPFQGYRFQVLYVNKIEKMLISRKEEIFNLATNIIERIFKAEVEGTYWDYKTVSIRFGALVYTKSLEKLRKKLLRILFFRIRIENDKKRVLKMVNSLANATSFPTRGEYSDALELMIMRNINTMIDFYSKLINSKTSFAVMQEIEQQMSFQKRRFTNYKNNNKKSAQNLLKRSAALLQKIRNDKSYKIYRVFVGDITDFWDESDNYEKIREERQKQVTKNISILNESNLRKWSKIILSIAFTYPLKQHHEFENLFVFARELGKTKPELAIKLLKALDKKIPIKNFLTDLLIGIRQSGRKDIVYGQINKWLSSKDVSLIFEIPFTYWVIDKTLVTFDDFEIFDKLASMHLAKDNREELDCRIAQALPWIYEFSPSRANRILFEILERMPLKNIAFFTRTLTMAQHRGQIVLKKWTFVQIKRLAKVLLRVERLDYHEEEILAIYACKDPLGIVDFFKSRIRLSKVIKKTDYLPRYDAIPFHLDELAKTITNLPDYASVIRKVLKEWILTKDWLLQWEGKHLLYRISPNLDKTLASELSELIRSGEKNRIIGAIEVLDAYEGAPVIDELCKMALVFSKGDKDVKKIVGRALYQTGVVMGEFGMRDAYKNRQDRVKMWSNDGNKYVKEFAKEYLKSLEKTIQQEQKRTEEEIMKMKKGVDV